MKKSVLILAAALSTLTMSAFAGAPSNGPYIDAGGGLSFVDYNTAFNSNPFKSDMDISSFAKLPSTWDNAAGALRAAVGYNFLNFLGAEVSYTHYIQHNWKATGTQTTLANVGTVNVRMDTSALQLLAKGHYTFDNIDLNASLGTAYEMDNSVKIVDQATDPDITSHFDNAHYWTLAYGIGAVYYTPWVDGLGISANWLGTLSHKNVKFKNSSGSTFSYNAPSRNDIILGLHYAINL